MNKVSKGAKIRNRYNQVPHLTQDTNGKVTNSQIDITNARPVHEPLVPIAYAQKSPLNVHADVLSEAKDQSGGPSLHLNPNFEDLSSEGSSKHAHLHILAYAFVARPANSLANIALTKACSVSPVSSKLANLLVIRHRHCGIIKYVKMLPDT